MDVDVLPDENDEGSITWAITKLETLQKKSVVNWKLKEFRLAFSTIKSALEHGRSGESGSDVGKICGQLFLSLYSQYASRIVKKDGSTALHLSKLVILADEFHSLFEADFNETSELNESVAEIVHVMRQKGWFSVAEKSPEQFEQHDACMFLNSCVSLGFWNRSMDHFVTKHFFLELIRSDLNIDDYKELSETLFAAFSKIKPPSIVRILKAMRGSRKKLKSLNEQCKNMLVRDILQAVRDEVAKGNKAWLKTPCASYFCWTVAKCHHADLKAMDTIISARLRTLKSQQKKMSTTELACLVHSTAILNIRSPEVVKSAKEFFKSDVKTIDQTNGCRLLWGLCVHGALTEAQFYHLVYLMMQYNKDNPKANSGIMQVVAQSHVYLDVSGRLSKKPGTPYSRKCKGFVKLARSVRKDSLRGNVSNFQKSVQKHLDKDLKLKVTSEKYLLDGHVVTDIHVEDSNLVVEVDGPTHFASNMVDGMPYLLGKTVFRNKLLTLAGFKVNQWCQIFGTSMLAQRSF